MTDFLKDCYFNGFCKGRKNFVPTPRYMKKLPAMLHSAESRWRTLDVKPVSLIWRILLLSAGLNSGPLQHVKKKLFTLFRKHVTLTVTRKNNSIIKQNLKISKHCIFRLILRKINCFYWTISDYTADRHPCRAWAACACATGYSGPPNHAFFFDCVL
jgi:hypothetical protein